jgi:glutamate-1-semialdehyde 2,1-aminomutase
VAGKRLIMDRMAWGEGMVLHYGTFNGHRLIMKVIAANLDLLAANDGAAWRRLDAIGDAAIAVPCEVFARHKVKAIVQGFGPMFQIYFTERRAIRDYRDYCAFAERAKYSRFVHRLHRHGIYMTPSNGLHWTISTAHSDADVGLLGEAADLACRDIS